MEPRNIGTEPASAGGIDERFQRGQVAVSACWAITAVLLLWFGASRRIRALRYAGFVLFSITLGKIFLYDLAALSPAARAISFIAVGTLLLTAGAFYQRLLENDDESENGNAEPPAANAVS